MKQKKGAQLEGIERNRQILKRKKENGKRETIITAFQLKLRYLYGGERQHGRREKM